MRKTFLYLLLLTFLQSFASDTTKTANRIGIIFSKDITTDFESNSNPKSGYSVGLNYAKEINRTWSAGIGVAYSELSAERVYEGWWYAGHLRTVITNHNTYAELPLFAQANIGKSEKIRPYIRFGGAVTAFLKYSYSDITTYTDTLGTVSTDARSYEEDYKLFSSGENGMKARIKWSAFIAIGAEIKLSEHFVFSLAPALRYYPKIYEGDMFAAGVQAGVYWRF